MNICNNQSPKREFQNKKRRKIDNKKKRNKKKKKSRKKEKKITLSIYYHRGKRSAKIEKIDQIF